MKTSMLNLSWLWLVMVTIVLLIPACSAQSPADTLTASPTPILASPTPAQPTFTVPPPTPTLAPTATPVPGLLGYLPLPADLPPSFEWSLSWEAPNNFDPLTTLDVAHTRYYSEAGWLMAQIKIVTTPYEQGAVGLQFGHTGTPVESVTVGQFSEAYLISEDPLISEFSFVKGNILVTLQGPLTMDDAVKLAQILEARIPENITELTPITFPDTLDPIAAAKFENFAMGQCTPENTVAVPMTVFSTQERFNNCLQMDWIASEPYNSHKLEYVIYDVQNQKYMVKYSSAHGLGMLFLPGLPGIYEMRVAMDDALIAVLPFEVR